VIEKLKVYSETLLHFIKFMFNHPPVSVNNLKYYNTCICTSTGR